MSFLKSVLYLERKPCQTTPEPNQEAPETAMIKFLKILILVLDFQVVAWLAA